VMGVRHPIPGTSLRENTTLLSATRRHTSSPQSHPASTWWLMRTIGDRSTKI